MGYISSIHGSGQWVTCTNCRGKGYTQETDYNFEKCEVCNGYGRVKKAETKPTLKEETITMSGTNYSTAVMLFNEDIKAISIVYEPDVDGKPKQQRYTFKTLNKDLKKGDLVVIPTDTRHGYTVVLVDAVDVEVDFESSVQLKWIVDKVHVEGYQEILANEAKLVDVMKKSEVRHKKEEIKGKVFSFVKEEEIKAFAITHAPVVTALESKEE